MKDIRITDKQIDKLMDRFSVSLFNGMPTVLVYLIPNSFL